jgi:hypothetical protein
MYHRSESGQGVTNGIKAHPHSFTGMGGLRVRRIWRMVHVRPEWSHDMAYDDTRHKRG